MEETTIRVDGMSCEHCVKAVNGALSAVAGVSSVSVDLAGGLVQVTFDPAQTSLESLKAEIEDQGYDVVE